MREKVVGLKTPDLLWALFQSTGSLIVYVLYSRFKPWEARGA